jgi:hypothetical protein
MKSLLVCALLAAAAHAQTVATVYVTAPDVRITCGASVQLAALARDGAGNPVNASFAWSSNNTAVASVDSTGAVQTASLGFVDITATASGRQGIIRLQVLPQRIEVTPGDSTINFGAQQQFAATAYDSQGQPIPGAALTWRVLVGGGTTDSSTVPITTSGLLTARTLGYYVVRASFVYPSIADQFEREFAGSTTLRIVPAGFRLKPLVSSSNSYPSFRIRGKRSNIAVNDSGRIAFASTLDGMTEALLTWGNSTLSPLAVAGTPGLAASTVFYDFDNASIDSRGNVLAQASMIGSSSTLVMANSDGLVVLLPDRVVADAVLDVSGMSVNRFSLSEGGDIALRGNFHYFDSTVNYNGFLRYSGGAVFLEASTRDPLPGLTGTVSFDDQYGLDAGGVLYFSASAGNGRAVYRKELFRDPVKVIAIGDTLNGQVVTQLPQIAVASAGDLVVRATLADGSQVLARYSGGASGKPPAVLNSSPGYVNLLYFANAQGGVVWLGDNGSGYGLYLWPAGDSPSRQVLARFGPSPTGEPVADFYSAAVDANGTVYASVRGVNTAWMLIRVNNSPSLIAANGTQLSTSANLDLYTSLVPGDRSGPLHIMAGGNQQSIFQPADRGLLPTLLVGDGLPGGAAYTGNNFPRKSPSGTLYVTTDNGVFQVSDTGASLLAAYPFPMPDGVNVNAPFNLAVNDSNQFLAIAGTNSSHQRLTLFDGKTLRSLGYFAGVPPFQTQSPSGGVFQSVNELALSESGQAMINAGVAGGPGGLFVYDDGVWKTVCALQSCKLDGETVSSIGQLHASNNRFCAAYNTSIGNSRIDCWESGVWTNLLKRGDITSDGTEISNVNFLFDINRRGDLAVSLNTGLSGQNLFLKTMDGYSTVQSTAFPGPDGLYITGLYAIDLRDDRRVFFLAMDNTSRMVVYEADPQQ